jgi:hypothetical protein
MRIDKHRWQEEIGRLLAGILIDQRVFAQEQADFAGISLADYAALAVLQYLEDNHGDDLEVIEHNVN